MHAIHPPLVHPLDDGDNDGDDDDDDDDDGEGEGDGDDADAYYPCHHRTNTHILLVPHALLPRLSRSKSNVDTCTRQQSALFADISAHRCCAQEKLQEELQPERASA